jgi:hypothetical protein
MNIGVKWNWGTGITLVYSGFVIFMLSMVFLCVKQEFFLVTPDYYAQELKYQHVIDGKANTDKLSEPVKISPGTKAVTVQFPAELKSIESGSMLFYRPDNAKHDMELPLKDKLTYEVAGEKFVYGLYKVKMTWVSNGVSYFDEMPMFISK